jgi:hypothetical protein
MTPWSCSFVDNTVTSNCNTQVVGAAPPAPGQL